MINESAASGSQLASFETEVKRCKLSPATEGYSALPTFYPKGNHAQAINPDEGAGKTKGKIKAETYDVLLIINISGQNQKVWLENFQLKPATAYKISTNLNAGGIIYGGTARDIKSMRLYPAGTAASQTGNPSPVKNLEIISYTSVKDLNCCTPGTFDVLLQTGNDKYEWRKSVAVTTGTKTEIK
jgi:hypothetical protein